MTNQADDMKAHIGGREKQKLHITSIFEKDLQFILFIYFVWVGVKVEKLCAKLIQ